MTVRFLLDRLCHSSHVRNALATVALMLLASCNSITSTPAVIADSGQRWALLPLENLSTTPLAGEKAATLLETQLRRRGVSTLQVYPDSEPATLAALLDGKARFRKANQWARSTGFRYAITGAVTEWHYKTGADKEPAVGLNLKLIDIPTGQVLWQATGSRIGWGFGNLSRTGNKVVADLVGQMKIRRQSVPVPIVDNTTGVAVQTGETAGFSPIVATPDGSVATPELGAATATTYIDSLESIESLDTELEILDAPLSGSVGEQEIYQSAPENTASEQLQESNSGLSVPAQTW